MTQQMTQAEIDLFHKKKSELEGKKAKLAAEENEIAELANKFRELVLSQVQEKIAEYGFTSKEVFKRKTSTTGAKRGRKPKAAAAEAAKK